MAKIKGFELKKIVNFRGHEGEDLIQGDVYYNGKRVGYYSQDAWGGMDIFDIDWKLDMELKKKIKEISDNYLGNILFKKIDDLYGLTYNFTLKDGKKYEPKGYEYLFSDLLELKHHEDLYKKYSKKFKSDNITIVYKDLFNIQIYRGLPMDLNGKTYFNYTNINDFIVE